MRNRRITPRYLFGIFLLGGTFIMTTACSSQRYDRGYWHENFKNSLAARVGQNFDKRWGWGDPRALVNTTTLPNGRVAYTFWLDKSLRACQYTVEVNPETRIVVATSWTGDDCILVP
jgi:hypothetical protein